MAKRILALVLCIVMAVSLGTFLVSATEESDELDVGLGTEDIVEEESKGCVGGAAYLPVAAVAAAAALVVFKKRA